MTSDSETIFVWIYLPGQIAPTLCGRVGRFTNPNGSEIGEFIYQRQYLQNPLAVPLDPVLLPLRNIKFEGLLLNGNFSVLLDAGPDSWGRREIAQAMGVQTDLGYLLHAAGDQVGAITFSSHPDTAPLNIDFNGYPCATLNHLLEFAELVEKNLPVPEKYHNLFKVGTSAGGARPKATILHEGRQWLAKFPSTSDPVDLPSNPRLEKAALDLAELIGLDVPRRMLIQAMGKDILLVERFDRQFISGTINGWARHRYASARTLFFSKPEVQRYLFTGSYQRLSLELASWSHRPKYDRIELFRRIAFNCLINNLDDHDLNHGFIDRGQGFELSPLFDVVPQRPVGSRPRLALNFGAFGAAATRKNLLSECNRYGLSEEQANTLIESIRSAVRANWEPLLIANGISGIHIERIAPAFLSEYFDL